ncbi:MAG: Hsp20/alpha crystallin family protein [Bacteroidales bacterium]|nr:Hsp20/alpha crystallin family protein [Bacteroidales bacterium]MCF8327616.1 Hsp20/alpha crystallin family protein [Bacteroidales bacterium]
MLERFFNDDLMDWNLTNFSGPESNMPAVNVKEDDNEFNIEVATPGLKKDDFSVSVDNGRLTISAEREDEKKDKDEEGNYTRQEFSYQSFQRSFQLPDNVVDADKIKANYNDGILNVNIPKREEAKPKPAKEIKIS